MAGDKIAEEKVELEKGGENDCSNGPVKKRKCTDILCALLYIANWVLFVFLFIHAMSDNGDPAKLLAPADFRGHGCGLKAEANWAPYLEDARYTGYLKRAPDYEEFEYLLPAMNVTTMMDKMDMDKYICGAVMKGLMVPGTISLVKWNKLCENITSGTGTISSSALTSNMQGSADQVVNEIPVYFTQTCVKSCDVAGNSNNQREYKYRPDPDRRTRFIMDKFWEKVDANANFGSALSSLFTFKAMNADICPYNTDFCVLFPGFGYEAVGNTCIFKVGPGIAGLSNEILADKSAVTGGLGDAIADVARAWDTLVLTVVIGLAVGFVFMVLLRFIVGYLVWGAILIVFAIFLVGGLFLYMAANKCADGTTTADCPAETGGYSNDASERDLLLYLSYFLLIDAGIYLLIIFCMRNKIKLGIAVNKVAAKFVGHHKAIIFGPPLQLLVTLVWWIVWIVAMTYIISNTSAGEDKPDKAYTRSEAITQCIENEKVQGSMYKDLVYSSSTCGVSFTGDDMVEDKECWRCALPKFNINLIFWYTVFSLLWTNAFIVACGYCTIAGAVAFWYFTANAKKGHGFVIAPALKNCFRYHLGSLAFGSFILAVVQTIKWYLTYLQKQAESAGAGKNPVVRLVFALLQYCIRCFERFIKFLNKNAYIQIAILGKNFCRSAWAAFMLILRNMGRIAALVGIGKIVSGIGLLFITIATGFLGYLLLGAMHDDINNGWLVIFLCFVIGYIAAKLFMMVFGLTVDCVLQCFIADEELNKKGSGGAQFTPPELEPFIDREKPKKGRCGCC